MIDHQTSNLSPDARAADVLVRALEQQILRGDLADGAHLPAERDLMEQFGVSRTVVREAVTLLASRGMVESRPRYRPVARRPGFDAALSAAGGIVTHLLKEKAGVRNLYGVRIFIEAALVRYAALNARKEDIEALKLAVEANGAAIEDSDRFYETDVNFHAVFYQVPRNPAFPAIHNAFTTWLAGHWRQMPRSPERNQVNFSRHSEICQAVVDRDPDAAEAAMNAHLNAAWEYVRGTFPDA